MPIIVFLGILTTNYLSATDVYCQSEIKRPNYFLKFGYGNTYGFLGINFELKKNRIGGYCSIGYHPPWSIKKDSVFFSQHIVGGGGFRFYLKTQSKSFTPRLTFYSGWLFQYYYGVSFPDTSYVHVPKNPQLYGPAIGFGCSYNKKIAIFDFDINYLMPFFAFNNQTIVLPNGKKSSWGNPLEWLRPSIGIGIYLDYFFYPENYLNFSEIYEKKIKNKKLFTQVKDSNDMWSDVCNNLLVLQQKDSNGIIAVKINTDSFKHQKVTNKFTLPSQNNIVKVYLVDKNYARDSLCCYFNKINDEDSLLWKGVSGEILFLSNKKSIPNNNSSPYSVTIKLSDILFVNQTNTAYKKIDKIIIRDLKNDNFCLEE